MCLNGYRWLQQEDKLGICIIQECSVFVPGTELLAQMGAERFPAAAILKNSDLHTRPIFGQKLHKRVVLRKCHLLRKTTSFFLFLKRRIRQRKDFFMPS